MCRAEFGEGRNLGHRIERIGRGRCARIVLSRAYIERSWEAGQSRTDLPSCNARSERGWLDEAVPQFLKGHKNGCCCLARSLPRQPYLGGARPDQPADVAQHPPSRDRGVRSPHRAQGGKQRV